MLQNVEEGPGDLRAILGALGLVWRGLEGVSKTKNPG